MMNTIWKIGVSGALAVLMVAPVYAAKQNLDDSALNGITGNGNNISTITGNSSLISEMGNGGDDAGSIRIGSHQWNHGLSTDASNHKGASDQSGANSRVEAYVTASINALLWGARAQASTINISSVVGAGR